MPCNAQCKMIVISITGGRLYLVLGVYAAAHASLLRSVPFRCTPHAQAIQVVISAPAEDKRSKSYRERVHLTPQPACRKHQPPPCGLSLIDGKQTMARRADGSAAPHMPNPHRAASSLMPGCHACAQKGSCAGAVAMGCRLQPEQPASVAIKAAQAPILTSKDDLNTVVQQAHHARRRVDC